MVQRSRLIALMIALVVTGGAISASPQTITVSSLIPFTSADGNAYATQVQGRNGNYYAVTNPVNGTGTNFDFSSNGKRATVYSFVSSTFAYEGLSSLTLGSDGYFYGTIEGTQTISGGGDMGEFYRVSSSGVYSLLHVFSGADGIYPTNPPIEATDGNFYGTTANHGNASTVYKYTRSGQFSVIYTTTTDTGLGCERVMLGNDGNLYVTCIGGGFKRNGTIIKLTTSGQVLQYYKFPGGATGSYPALLLQGSDGNFYGLTLAGGVSQSGGYGTIFQFTPQGKVNTLYQIGSLAGSGRNAGALIEGSDGNLYGLTIIGGANDLGTLFRCTTSGSYTDLYSFASSVGSDPDGLMQSTTGLLYGSTYFTGFISGYGGIFTANLGLGPFVSTVERASSVGKVVEILGQSFTGTTSVTFNGVAASSFTVSSDTYLTAVVPTGATTGPVVVSSPTQTLTSNRNLTIR